MAATPLDLLEPADMPENRRHIQEGQEDNCLLAYWTKGEYKGKERTLVVTYRYTPASTSKQAYAFADNLEAMRQELLAHGLKVRDKAPDWRKRKPCVSGINVSA